MKLQSLGHPKVFFFCLLLPFITDVVYERVDAAIRHRQPVENQVHIPEKSNSDEHYFFLFNYSNLKKKITRYKYTVLILMRLGVLSLWSPSLEKDFFMSSNTRYAYIHR